MVNHPTSNYIQMIETSGFQLSYVIEGNGIPALIIGSHIYYPRTFSENLRKNMQLIFMDHRGFGKAVAPIGEHSFELASLLDDIEALRQKLGLDKVVVIGHSIHALMAIEYARKYPHAVSNLILIASSPIAGSALYQLADRYFQESVCPERKAALAKNLSTLEAKLAAHPQSAFITRMLVFGPMIWYDFSYDASALWQGVSLNPEGANSIWGPLFADYAAGNTINSIQCPVFLALGRYDYWNPPHLWESIRPQFNEVTIRVFEKSGHTPQFEEPENFDRELLAFLQNQL